MAWSLTTSSAVQFTDVTKSAGIAFTHDKGSQGTSTILEEAGPGVCVADYFTATLFIATLFIATAATAPLQT